MALARLCRCPLAESPSHVPLLLTHAAARLRSASLRVRLPALPRTLLLLMLCVWGCLPRASCSWTAPREPPGGQDCQMQSDAAWMMPRYGAAQKGQQDLPTNCEVNQRQRLHECVAWCDAEGMEACCAWCGAALQVLQLLVRCLQQAQAMFSLVAGGLGCSASAGLGWCRGKPCRQ
jgi:hypothetical protein